MRSESTRALGQPRLTKPTLGLAKDIRENFRGNTQLYRPHRHRAGGLQTAPGKRLSSVPSPFMAEMSRWIVLETLHGPVRAWRADPTGPSRGAVVVLQEIFGVNPHIRSVVDRFAAAGFVAVAPDLFD